MKNNYYYETTDLNFCVVLQYFGIYLEKIDKSSGSPFRFCFPADSEERINEINNGYMQGSLTVEPKRLLSVMKETKSMIYNH
ncbi:MAG: DUF5659 domain-containing protein [Patescibacteria group bacterium]